MAIKFGDKNILSIYKGTKKVNDIIRNGVSYLMQSDKGLFEKSTGMTMLAFINNGYAESGKAYDSQGNEVKNWSTYWDFTAYDDGSQTFNLKSKTHTTLPTKIPVIINKKLVTSFGKLFWQCTNLKTLDLSDVDTSNINNMSFTFCYCSSLVSLNLSNWNTSNVIKMNTMFSSSNSLTELDLTSFDTSKVTTMNGMFNNCTKLKNIYVGENWDTSIADMTNMFKNCGTSSVTKV